jgi:hypothetical protein
VTQDHERIDELLTGYALLALSGEDAEEADRLLAEHVPHCPRCRRTLTDLQALTGDLALAAPPLTPPDTLLPALRRSMDEVPLAGRRVRRGALVALAASAVALVALGGLSLVLGNRLSDAETRAGTALEILSVMRSPGALPVSLDPQGETPAWSGMVEVSAPEVRRLYLASDDCPDPAPGKAYQVWLGTSDGFVPFGEMFRPQGGVVLLELEVDTSRYEEILITEEAIGDAPARPNTDGPRWWAAL